MRSQLSYSKFFSSEKNEGLTLLHDIFKCDFEALTKVRGVVELVVCGKSAGTMGTSIRSFTKIIARHTKRAGNTRRPRVKSGTTVGLVIRVKS